MALVLSNVFNRELTLTHGDNEPTVSVGLCVFFGGVYKRLSRWEHRDEAFLEEPHACFSEAFTSRRR